MTEALLKRNLVKALKVAMPGCVVFRHEDKFTGGIPDLSLTWRGITYWIEVKYDRGKLSALQALCLARIAAAGGNAWLLTYREGIEPTTAVPWPPSRNRVGSIAGKAHVAEWFRDMMEEQNG